MNVGFCGDNSGRSKKVSYFWKKIRGGGGGGQAPLLDPPLSMGKYGYVQMYA